MLQKIGSTDGRDLFFQGQQMLARSISHAWAEEQPVCVWESCPNLYPLVICYSLRTWKWPIQSSWIYPTRKWWIFPSFFVGLPGRVYDTYMILILIRVDHRSQLENGGSFQLANCKRLPVGLIIGSLKPRKFTAETVAPSGYGAICIIKKTSVYITIMIIL